MVIGITGGVGAGKSAVLSYLSQKYKANLLVADEIARQLLMPGERAHAKVKAIFPEELFEEDGTIKRQEMAGYIFMHPDMRQKQNDIVFPMVKEHIVGEIAKMDPDKLIVIEAALLIEEHYDEICDTMWYIHSSEEKRRARLKENRGYPDERIDAMFRSQLTEKDFQMHCEVVIDNDGTLENTYLQIDKILRGD